MTIKKALTNILAILLPVQEMPDKGAGSFGRHGAFIRHPCVSAANIGMKEGRRLMRQAESVRPLATGHGQSCTTGQVLLHRMFAAVSGRAGKTYSDIYPMVPCHGKVQVMALFWHRY